MCTLVLSVSGMKLVGRKTFREKMDTNIDWYVVTSSGTYDSTYNKEVL